MNAEAVPTRAELLAREREMRQTHEYRMGFEAGRRSATESVQGQMDATFETLALQLMVTRCAFNAAAKVAHEREAALEGWKAEAGDWRAEYNRVFDELCSFTSEALMIVEQQVTERLRQKYYLALRLWHIRKEHAPGPPPNGKKNDPAETWGECFFRLHQQTLEAFVREAHEKNYLQLIYDFEKKTFGSSRLEQRLKERAA